MRFAQLNCLATFAALAVFAVGISAVIVDWYSYSEEFNFTTTSATGASSTVTFNSSKLVWSLEGMTARVRPTGGVESSTFKEHDSSSGVWSTFKLIQAFVLIALILAGILSIFLIVCFACAIRNQLLFLLGMNVLRISLLLVASIILVSLVIAFLGFIGINNALSDDTPGCNKGYCRRISDSTKEELGTATLTLNGVTATGNVIVSRSWGPVEGWYLDLACIPIAIVLAIIVVINKFPIPVDSVTIGEAL
jgi:hypothetical protein